MLGKCMEKAGMDHAIRKPQGGVRLYRLCRQAAGEATANSLQLCSADAVPRLRCSDAAAADPNWCLEVCPPDEAGGEECLVPHARVDESLALVLDAPLRSMTFAAGGTQWLLRFPCSSSFTAFASEMEDAEFHNAFGFGQGQAGRGSAVGRKRRESAPGGAGTEAPAAAACDTQAAKRQRVSTSGLHGSQQQQQQQQQHAPPMLRPSHRHSSSSDDRSGSDDSACVARLTFHDASVGLAYAFALQLSPSATHMHVRYKAFSYAVARADREGFRDVIEQVADGILLDLDRERRDDRVDTQLPDGGAFQCDLLLAKPRLVHSYQEPTGEELPDLLLQDSFCWRDTKPRLLQHLKAALYLAPPPACPPYST